MELSIIVPVYNTKLEILERCIKSTLSIKSIKYEVLIINDGSNLENSKIYKKYIEEVSSKKIKYIEKKNGGVSSARNKGIKEAQGKYLFFLDSDDTINSEFFEKKFFEMNEDVVIYNRYLIKDNKQELVKEIDYCQELHIEDNQIIIDAFINNNSFHGPWAKLYRASFIKKNNLEFEESMIQGEDAYFNLKILNLNPKIYYTNMPIYNYYYDYQTTDKRWEKYPLKMLNNLEILYNEENNINKANEKNINIIIKKYVSELFTGSLIINGNKKINKIEKLELLNKIVELNKKINQNKKISKKIDIKIYLITKKKWTTLTILSTLRKLYLQRIKK